MKLRIKRLNKELPLPKHARNGDAGLDLYSSVTTWLDPGQAKLIPTGICAEIPRGYAGFVHPRSGFALKNGVGMLNSPGVIDSNYRGEIGAILINHSKKPFEITRGMRVCQLIIKQVETVECEEVAELSDSNRGDAGFGSSGQF